VPLFSLPVTEPGVPRPCVFCKGGYDAADTRGFGTAQGPQRSYGADHLCSIPGWRFVRPSFVGAGISVRSIQDSGDVQQIKSLGHPPTLPKGRIEWGTGPTRGGEQQIPHRAFSPVRNDRNDGMDFAQGPLPLRNTTTGPKGSSQPCKS
jgi:hypothetical protein